MSLLGQHAHRYVLAKPVTLYCEWHDMYSQYKGTKELLVPEGTSFAVVDQNPAVQLAHIRANGLWGNNQYQETLFVLNESPRERSVSIRHHQDYYRCNYDSANMFFDALRLIKRAP